MAFFWAAVSAAFLLGSVKTCLQYLPLDLELQIQFAAPFRYWIERLEQIGQQSRISGTTASRISYILALKSGRQSSYGSILESLFSAASI